MSLLNEKEYQEGLQEWTLNIYTALMGNSKFIEEKMDRNENWLVKVGDFKDVHILEYVYDHASYLAKKGWDRFVSENYDYTSSY